MSLGHKEYKIGTPIKARQSPVHKEDIYLVLSSFDRNLAHKYYRLVALQETEKIRHYRGYNNFAR
jgi:hypothetical protein